LKLKYKFFVTLLLISVLFSYSYLNKIKNEKFVDKDTYIILEKNISQKSILKKLVSKNIDISYIHWRINSLINKDYFVPKAGEYLIPRNSSINHIQDIFHKGDTITRSFTLVEGSNAITLKRKLINNKYLSGEIPVLVEGIYKPDTYYFKYGYPRIKLLKRMKIAQDKIINKIWESIPKKFILKNKYELLILSSIIQNEAKSMKDSQLMASVFINRLNKKMKLQSDVTLAYGLNINGKYITKKMLKTPHPFNTYFFYGLPPTPISYPGQNALKAFNNLKKTDYMYFVADGKGGHRFSETYNLHKKNIELWKNNIVKD
jgi:UPF0755 protein